MCDVHIPSKKKQPGIVFEPGKLTAGFIEAISRIILHIPPPPSPTVLYRTRICHLSSLGPRDVAPEVFHIAKFISYFGTPGANKSPDHVTQNSSSESKLHGKENLLPQRIFLCQ
nr:hypothetical protein HIGPJJAF_00006 [Gallid alphaherpesvirus 2]